MGWGVLPGGKPRGGRRQLPDAGNVVAGVLHGLTQGVIGHVGGAGDGGGLGVQIHGGLYAGQVIVKPDAVQKLESLGVTATVRRSLGGDIDASCGQLRRKYEKT